MQHLWKKLASKPKDWRRIYKALHVMEYLIKNGAPRCIQEIKDEMFKIRSFQDFSYNDNGTDRGSGLRDKARAVCELLSDAQKLEEEREFARKNKEKFGGNTNAGFTGIQSNPAAAAPASGKYGGFGSEDIHKLGYGDAGQMGKAYDPFSKAQSVSTAPEKSQEKRGSKGKQWKDSSSEAEEEKPKKKKKKRAATPSESSDSDSSDEEEKPKKARRRRKRRRP